MWVNFPCMDPMGWEDIKNPLLIPNRPFFVSLFLNGLLGGWAARTDVSGEKNHGDRFRGSRKAPLK